VSNIVEIIVIKFNCPEVEVDCINSIIKHTKIAHNLTIYNNYPHNHNIGSLWNELINRSDAKYICLLNSDTIVTERWLERMLLAFELIDDVGVVGPSTDNARNQQNTKVEETFIDFGETYPEWMLGGFCLVFPKEVFKKVGGFSAKFGFYGQEVEFIKRIEDAGLKQIWRTDSFVHHVGSASAKKADANGIFDMEKERARSKELLKPLLQRYNS
jgi:GT2 family glycosyltransferase